MSLIAKISASSLDKQRRSRSRPAAPKPKGRTYEHLFYRKKAFIEKGPDALCRDVVVAYTPPTVSETNLSYPIPHGQGAYLAKVVTETVSEYENEEESHGTRMVPNSITNECANAPQCLPASHAPPFNEESETETEANESVPSTTSIAETETDVKNEKPKMTETGVTIPAGSFIPLPPANRTGMRSRYNSPSDKINNKKSFIPKRVTIVTDPVPVAAVPEVPKIDEVEEVDDDDYWDYPSNTDTTSMAAARSSSSHTLLNPRFVTAANPTPDHSEMSNQNKMPEVIFPGHRGQHFEQPEPPVKTPVPIKHNTDDSRNPNPSKIPEVVLSRPEDSHSHAYQPRKATNQSPVITITPSPSPANHSKIPSHCNTPPEVILPGHRDRHLDRPPVNSPCVDTTESTSATELDEVPELSSRKPHQRSLSPGNIYRKCYRLKTMLSQSESTVRYLTELLAEREKELNALKADIREFRDRSTNTPPLEFQPRSQIPNDNGKFKSNDSIPVPPSTTTTPSTTPIINVCIAPRGASETKPSTTTTTTTSTTPCAIPKFDLDEFIQKFFRHILFREDLMNNANQSEPFEYIQLFRAAIAARDCMTQNLREKLKYGYQILKQRYEILQMVKATSEKPLDIASYLDLVDSHRRFVRYIYYYLKKSLEDVENFEQTYIPNHSRSSTSGSQRKMMYSYETNLSIDGVKYSGVFIPIEELTKK